MEYASVARWPDLPGVARSQAGVVTRAQLGACGTTWNHCEAQIRAGRWRSLGSNVVVLHTGELSRLQRWWAVVLHAGPAAALAGLSAAEAGGLKGWERTETHLLVPKGRHVAPLSDEVEVVVHESRRFRSEDVHPARDLPQTRIPRSLVDSAAWFSDEAAACGILAAGVQQGKARPGDLRREIEATVRIQHRRVLLGVLGDIEGGAHSFAEIDLGRLCRQAGLRPPDHRQFRFEGRKRRYLDAEWDLDDGSTLILEIDGGLHRRIGTWWHDLAREREVVIEVGRVLRCSTVELRLNPRAIARDLEAAGVPRIRRRQPDVSASHLARGQCRFL